MRGHVASRSRRAATGTPSCQDAGAPPAAASGGQPAAAWKPPWGPQTRAIRLKRSVQILKRIRRDIDTPKATGSCNVQRLDPSPHRYSNSTAAFHPCAPMTLCSTTLYCTPSNSIRCLALFGSPLHLTVLHCLFSSGKQLFDPAPHSD